MEKEEMKVNRAIGIENPYDVGAIGCLGSEYESLSRKIAIGIDKDEEDGDK